MKRILLLLTVGLVVAGVIGGTASSDEGPYDTVVLCGLLDGNNEVILGLGVIQTYKSGKVTLDCVADGAANPNNSVVNWNYDRTGRSCNIQGYGSTTVWKNRIGRDGVSQLHCETYAKEPILLRASSDTAGLG